MNIGNFKFKFSLAGLLQYICIYLFLICHDAAVYRENTMALRIVIVLFSSTLLFYKSEYKHLNKNFFVFVLILSAYLILRGERNQWLNYIECIMITFITYNIDKDNFCRRFIYVVMFFVIWSLLFYIMGIIAPELLFTIFNKENGVRWATSWGWPYYLRGRWLYVVRMYELERNNSIFTEPGIWQMILNSSLFILLFMRNTLIGLSEKKVIRYIILISITVITTASTTAYLAITMIYAVYLVTVRRNIKFEQSKKYIKKVWTLIAIVCIFGIIILSVNYIMLGTESLIYKSLIKKIFEITDGGTSGHARYSMILICMKVALTNFFGVGEDYLSNYIQNLDEGANGAILIHAFASIGIIPVLFILGFYFRRLFYKSVPKMNALLIILLYVNTVLAQSRLLYPSLIILPIIYYDYCIKNIKSKLGD